MSSPFSLPADQVPQEARESVRDTTIMVYTETLVAESIIEKLALPDDLNARKSSITSQIEALLHSLRQRIRELS